MTSLWRFAWWIFVLTLGLGPAASFIGFVGDRRSLREVFREDHPPVCTAAGITESPFPGSAFQAFDDDKLFLALSSTGIVPVNYKRKQRFCWIIKATYCLAIP